MASGIDVSADDLKVFLQEVDDLLEMLDENVIRLEQEAGNADLLQEIFRGAHTLKGSSGMLGYDQMAHLTHQMEDLLDRVRKGTVAVSPEVVDALLMSLDGLKVLRDDLAGDRPASLDVTPIVAALQAAAEGEAPPEDADGDVQTIDRLVVDDPAIAARLQAAEGAGLPLLRLSLEINPQSEWAAVRCFQVLNELGAAGEVIASVPSAEDIEAERAGHSFRALVVTQKAPDELRAQLEAVDDVVSVAFEPWTGPETDAPDGEAAATTQAKQPGTRIEALSQTVRIDVERLDALMNMVGELVIDRTRMAQISRSLSTRHKEDDHVRALGETTTHIGKVVDELHESMMQVRMLPVGVLFSKLPRLVRDLARSTGKQVSLVVEGEDTEIDRSVIEEIKDPLIHLMRNAVDHGVETPDERQRTGKPETSVLRLVARHEQGQIAIELQDDGRGIDADAVRESAVRKGVISQEAADRLSPAEAVELIFEPGLTTAKQTTEVSGRGVGMDIVRRGIESLNGHVEVMTDPGQGTTFTMRLPLTLATFRGLLVAASGTVYAIPLNFVQETVRVESGATSTVGGRPVLRLRDSAMSVLRLADMFRSGVPIPMNAAEQPDGGYAVVVRAREAETDRPVAIVVDELVDQQEIVVKSLSTFLGRTRGIAGASILGDGKVVLILDVPTLMKSAQQATQGTAKPERMAS